MPQRNNVLIWLNGGGSKNDRYHFAAAYQGTCRNSGSFVPFDVVDLVFSEERKAMRKLCATITAIGATVLSSLVQAEGITGIYSCSSGVNNDRPITYVFNSNLMLRDDEKSSPFEYLTALNDGKLLYIGERKSVTFKNLSQQYGLEENNLKFWVKEQLILARNSEGFNDQYNDERFFNDTVVGEHELTLLKALACELGVDQSWIFSAYDRAVGTPSQTCERSVEAAQVLGVGDLKALFLKQNNLRLKRWWTFDKILVTVDIASAKVHEAAIDKSYPTKSYNCTVLNIDVPKIDPPENAIKAST